MFSWLKKKPAPPLRPQVIEPIYHWSDDEIPRYPPFMKGLPTVPPAKLLETQSELIDRISNTAITTPSDFRRLYMPTIERFAAFAHLLPASQSHHHRGAGGLLRHSLEVGLWALQSADKVLLDAAKSPSQRREMEPRWQFAVFVAALCHDAGKPVTDLTVTNRERTSVWKPIKEDLYDWATKNKVDAYFLDWREGRSRQHTALSNLIADRIIGADALEWIEEGGTELIIWLLESLNCNPGPINLIHDLVIKADQTSVERDLKSLGVAMAGYDLGVPVERHLTDIMRRFIKEGAWLVNEPGARLWNIDGHLYLVWPAAGEEIARQVREDGIPGIPRTPDGILDMLVERQIAFVREGAAGGDRLWKIAPACLAEKIPDIKLSAIRLRDEAMVSLVPIPSVDGKVIAGEEVATPTKAQAENQATEHQTKSEPEKIQEDTSAPAKSTESQSVQPQTAVPGATATLAVSSEAAPRSPHQETTHKEEAAASSSSSSGRGARQSPPTERQKPSIQLDGAIGEALKALVQDIKSGDKQMEVAAAVDSDGHLLLRWPDAFSGYGLTPKNIMDELTAREWLWIDPMAPLKKVIDGQFGSETAKAIRLEKEISDCLMNELGGIESRSAPAAETKDKPAHQTKSENASLQQPGAGKEKTRAKEKPKRDKTDNNSRQAKPASQSTSNGPHVAGHQDEQPQPTPTGICAMVDAGKEQERTGDVVAQAVSISSTNDGRAAPTKEEGAQNWDAAMKRPATSIDEIYSVIASIPGAAEKDGWKSIPRSAVIGACRKNGIAVTQGLLVDMAQQNGGRLIVDGAYIKIRQDSK